MSAAIFRALISLATAARRLFNRSAAGMPFALMVQWVIEP
jgi:hypothetical protein